MLKLKIKVNLPQLFCVVVFGAQMAHLSDLVGFGVRFGSRAILISGCMKIGLALAEAVENELSTFNSFYKV